ncbi:MULTISPECIES: hypothetical protein [Arcobacteraceae]|uniref:NADH dehydrogenase subunit G n=2 Tax=Arcobacteraceae TaxID=2808963 RepID=A0ABX2YC74_9BACT|nr:MULTISPECIES: hypothetical protein [Arcobacteraceae]OCL83056.1 NADH dehydrogenase subunit G [Arcobacter porcinus]OCL83453.1 NADH dehydrogenase subunit G [Arcobacter porcinus]OCL88226.1 NADH dehydrogenase subunit G [Arcobacter porcinus]OCL92492.1 NADH dehydrogenase subunit G [Arcobacter porcinus]OCL95120.1 NADH dehydrogenase subunit G [Aliarcobacter thereius LMG 24486]
MNLEKYDYILSIGTFFEDKNLFENIKKVSDFTYMHPIDKASLKEFYSQFIKYEVGSEEAVLALVLYFFTNNRSKELEDYLEELDIGYLSAESSCGEEEFEDSFELFKKASNKALVLGDDLENHQNIENILAILKNIEKYSDFELVFTNKKLENSFKNYSNFTLNEPEELKSFNGTILYFSNDSSLGTNLVASQTFLNIAKLNDKDFVSFSINNKEYKKQIILDKNLLGTIALINENISTYSFSKVVLKKEEI